MKSIARLLCTIGALIPALVVTAGAQSSSIFSASSSASATATSASSGKPSTFTLQQNALAMQLAAIKRQIREAQRCVQNATNPVVLRYPDGTINPVSQTDSLNCGRRLKQLSRQLESLSRKADAMAKDAQVQGNFLQGQVQDAKRALRTKAANRRSTSGM
jgi:hypothetical protein